MTINEQNNLAVLYVQGIYHSGTTVLGNLLGQLDGFFHAGELRTLWPKLTLPRSRCGCGEPLQECQLWHRILASRFGEGEERLARARQLWQVQRDVLRDHHTWRVVPALLAERKRGLPDGSPAAAYARELAGLYRAIARESGAQVIVDTSKEPSDAALLLLTPDLEVSVAQIVRDPRGLVYSILRFRAGGDLPESRWWQWRQSVYAAASWSAGNLAGASVRKAAGPGRSALLRYEDFVRAPRETVEQLAALAGRPGRLPGADAGAEPGTVTMQPMHTVGGNDNRFRTGEVRLREDVQWRSSLHRLDKAAVTAVCLPLMARYGYRLAP